MMDVVRWRARLPLLGGTVSWLVAQATTSAAGYFYWLLGARAYASQQIGQAASITSISIVVALVAGQAIMASLVVRLPQSSAPRAVLTSSVFAAAGLAAGLAAVGVVVLPICVPALTVLRGFGLALAMVAVCISQSVGLVVDGAALTLGRFRVLVGRNALFGAGKLAVVAVCVVAGAGSGTEVLVGSWAVVGAGTSCWALWRLRRATSGKGWSLATIRPGFGYQTVTAIGSTVPPQLLPTLVAAQVGASLAGDFSLTWLLGGLCFSVSPAVAQAMLVVDESGLSRYTRHAALIILALLVVPVTLFLTLGGPILGLFGPSYSTYGTALLIWLALSALPDAVTNIAVARWRVRENLGPAALLNGLIATVVLALVIGPLHATRESIASVGAAWFVAQTAGCGFVLARAMRMRVSGRTRLEAVSTS
jgi:hypothetical protein